jgi:hypothetical protein
LQHCTFAGSGHHDHGSDHKQRIQQPRLPEEGRRPVVEEGSRGRWRVVEEGRRCGRRIVEEAMHVREREGKGGAASLVPVLHARKRECEGERHQKRERRKRMEVSV